MNNIDRAYILVHDLNEPLELIRDVRHSLVALSMTSGLEDWAVGTLDLAFTNLDRALEDIEDLSDPVRAAWREQHPTAEARAAAVERMEAEDAASEPTGSQSDNVFHAEMRKRMAELEDSYANAPKITAARLDGWQARLSIIGRRVSAALATVERVQELDLDWQASGPLRLVEDALNTADSDVVEFQSDISDAKAKASQDGDSAQAAD